MAIYAGDTPLIKLQLKDTLGPVNLTEGTVKLVLKIENTRTEKTGLTITDAVNGKCEIRLAKTDLTEGECLVQPVIAYSDGREFAFNPTKFTVDSRL